jgi:hypothetical protein
VSTLPLIQDDKGTDGQHDLLAVGKDDKRAEEKVGKLAGGQDFKVAGVQNVKVAGGQDVKVTGGQDVKMAVGQDVKVADGLDFKVADDLDVKVADGLDFKVAGGQEVKVAEVQYYKVISELVENPFGRGEDDKVAGALLGRNLGWPVGRMTTGLVDYRYQIQCSGAGQFWCCSGPILSKIGSLDPASTIFPIYYSKKILKHK